MRASAFAPAKSGGGNLHWESSGTTCWETVDQGFPLDGDAFNVTCSDATVLHRTRGLALLNPDNARGVVTLLRVRGFLGVNWDDVPLNQVALRNTLVHFILQLVPRDPDLVNAPDEKQLLSGNRTPDQESNRILNQWVAVPFGQHGTVSAAVAGGQSDECFWFQEIDVRVKRRFSRTQWALVISATTTDLAGAEQARVYVNFRQLYRADDGL